MLKKVTYLVIHLSYPAETQLLGLAILYLIDSRCLDFTKSLTFYRPYFYGILVLHLQ